MDDLQQLATLLTKPEPSGETVGRGRRRLMQAIDATAHQRPARLARGRRAGWLAAGLGLATAATAAILVVTSGGTTPGRAVSGGTPRATAHSSGPAPARPRPSPSHPVPISELSGRQILLAAAATALKQRPGTYWHFKIRVNPKGHPKPPPGVHVFNTDESWVALDGKYWNAQPRCAAPPGTAVFKGPGYAGFYLGNLDVNYQVTRRLPTNPAALTAWVAKYNPHDINGPSFIPMTLISLLWQVRAPPTVRATAFQALAALPGVKSLGPVKGGVGLLITLPHVPAGDWIRLVVDPATSLVRSEGTAKGITIIHAGWTNQLPRIIPLPPKNACGT